MQQQQQQLDLQLHNANLRCEHIHTLRA